MNKLFLIIACMLSALSIHAADKISAKISNSSLSVNLDNETSFSAFQIDIALPQGIRAIGVEPSSRLASTPASSATNSKQYPFIVRSGEFEGNIFRVIAYAADAHAISDTKGRLVSIALSSVPTTTTDIEVKNIRMIKTADLSEVKLANVVCRDATNEDVYYVRAAEVANGQITIANASVAAGGSTTVTITPNTNYLVEHVMVNGVIVDSQLSSNKLTISDIKEDKEISATFKPVPAKTMTLNPSSCILPVGTLQTLTPEFTPAGVVKPALVWTSSNENVVTVSEEGIVSAVGNGTATVTAYAQDGSELSAKCTFTVSESQGAGTDTDISAYKNIVYIPETEVSPGSMATLSIMMNNEVATTGFQCDVYLPSGVTVAKDEDGFCEIELSQDRTTSKKTDYFTFAEQADGAIRILCNSTTSNTFSGNTGRVATINVNIAGSITNGVYPLVLKNVSLSDADSHAIKVDRVQTSLIVSSYTLGDANVDGEINVGDFTAIANYIMGKTPSSFSQQAADVNKDSDINVGDLTGEANLILYGTVEHKVAKASARDLMPSVIYAETQSVIAGNEFYVDVNIEGTLAFSGYQFDLVLPEGISAVMLDDAPWSELSEERTDARKTDCFYSDMMNENVLRVLCASTRGNEFAGKDGAVARIKLIADESLAPGDYTITISNGVISANGAASALVENSFITRVVDPLSIGSVGMDADKADIYDLMGRKLDHAGQKGIYIINGKKQIK